MASKPIPANEMYDFIKEAIQRDDETMARLQAAFDRKDHEGVGRIAQGVLESIMKVLIDRIPDLVGKVPDVLGWILGQL